jgi:TM2 domain-containing membrane protein YozV
MDPPPIREAPIPPMHLTCPFCQVLLAVSPSQAGSTTACPKCGGKFQIPLPTAQSGVGAGPHAASPNADVQAFASKKIAAGICGILLGCFGIHKFIVGLNTAGTIMLIVSLFGAILSPCLIVPALALAAMGIIGLAEGIIYLTKTDEDFYQTYAIQKKEWF